MPQFTPDQVVFGDGVGMGYWDSSHYREHQQFVQVLAQQTPAVLISDYDFLQMLTAGGNWQSSIVESHNQIHTVFARQIYRCWRDGLFPIQPL